MKKIFLLIYNGLILTVSVFSQSWSLTGNAGTSNSNFIGTTDKMPLILKVNNEWAGSSGYPDKDNVSFGYLSLRNALAGSGTSNTALGARALSWCTSASGNVAIGAWSLEWLTQGNNNVAIGVGTMCKTLTPGSDNVAIGKYALYNNTQDQNTAVGSESAQNNTTGLGLTAVGFKTLNKNTTGEFNTALGYQALLYNTTGYWNVALGSASLQSNTTGRFNTAGGNASLYFNLEGVENTAFGEQALGGNINGSYNTAVGCRSLHSVLYTPGSGDSGYGNGDANTTVGYESMKQLTTGGFNTGLGLRALQMNTTGNNNIAVGGYALVSNTTGNNNTAVGYGADVGKSNLTNATAIGYGAIATESNQVIIGNSDVTDIRAYVSWSTFSDKRMKKNIQANVPGLAFIKKLQPVTYNLNLGANSPHANKLYTGLIAQDVETAAKSVGYDFSGIDIDVSGDKLYSLRYSDFVAPLIQAVQELSAQNEAKDSAIASLQKQINTLTEAVNRLSGSSTAVKTVAVPTALLGQNYPNPFNRSTVINYSLPQNINSAKIVITDISGKVFKQIPVSGTGKGSVNIDANTLSPGVYLYSLYMDNMPVDTKKMVLSTKP